ncbi:TPA: plasmid partitioning/stability family protein [Salmonella enterica subsp. salamae serovar 35:g,m,s,t:-]|nr:plasmid partitioning/stability family protein [Salmonella enterica subsp. salamae serovar 35:g,m,s,t:-]HCA3549712.1 plasmid partitioning/stability family protein [Salmonella enterica subsp. salamae serovar 35:g,m,s,t:-]
MTACDERKKYTLYLHPTESCDVLAMNVISTVPRRSRGDLFRNVFIAGLVLQHLDSRLPVLLTSLFCENTSADQVVELISQTTGWKPTRVDIQVILDELKACALVSSDPAAGALTEQSTALDMARKKLSSLL